MNSTETRTARAAAFEAYRAAADAFSAAYATAGKCRSTSRLANLSHKAMEEYRFAQARHEQAIRAELRGTGATEAEIQRAALA